MDPIDIPFPISEWYQAYSEGALLALYRYQKYKTIPPEERQELRALTLLLSGKEDLRPVQEAVKHGQIIADAVCFTRDLINTPSQDKAPGVLADTAKKLGGEAGIQCKILSLPELKNSGWGGCWVLRRGAPSPRNLSYLNTMHMRKTRIRLYLLERELPLTQEEFV